MSNLFRVSISFYYDVPFNKKDDAKKFRMKWNPKRKMWHIDYTYSNPQGMLDEIYCMGYNENLFKFNLKFIESSYELEDEEIKQIQLYLVFVILIILTCFLLISLKDNTNKTYHRPRSILPLRL